MSLLETTENWLDVATWLTDEDLPGVENLKIIAEAIDNLQKPNGALNGAYRLTYNDLMSKKPVEQTEDEDDDFLDGEDD